jgi:hypothetical protein
MPRGAVGQVRPTECVRAPSACAQVDETLAEACLYLAHTHIQQGSLQTAYRYLVRTQQATGTQVRPGDMRAPSSHKAHPNLGVWGMRGEGGGSKHAAVASNLLRSLQARMPPATVAALGSGRAGDRTPG